MCKTNGCSKEAIALLEYCADHYLGNEKHPAYKRAVKARIKTEMEAPSNYSFSPDYVSPYGSTCKRDGCYNTTNRKSGNCGCKLPTVPCEDCEKPTTAKQGVCSKCNYKRNFNPRASWPQCKADGCTEQTNSSTGFCTSKHKPQADWVRQKQAKAEWFEAQPESNVSAAVIRYAITNDLDINLFTNTETVDECFLWKGATNGKYGMIGIRVHNGKGKFFSHPVLVHRLAYAMTAELPSSKSGPRPDTLTINHICRNTLCVNPSHLEVLTQQENWNYGDIEADCVICGTTFTGRPHRVTCGADECVAQRTKQTSRAWARKQRAA